jgi:predicted nucleic acid-binding protein
MARATLERLLIDTNLFVLWVVGLVNPHRISTYKRTSSYEVEDFSLLVNSVLRGREVVTTPHILAEVSNLTDLSGPEREVARRVLKTAINNLQEIFVPAVQVAEELTYPRLGLSDAGILSVARDHQCHVATDDFDLYHALTGAGLGCTYFTYLRVQQRGL